MVIVAYVIETKVV